MDSGTRATKIAKTSWEYHRHTIEDLYIKKGKKLEGSNGVIDLMKKHHGFYASKAQYENCFRKWHMRKNLKKKEWDSVAQTVRRTSCKTSHGGFVFKGIFLSEERITREIARYGIKTNNHPSGSHEEKKDSAIGPPQNMYIAADNAHTATSSQRGCWDLVYLERQPLITFAGSVARHTTGKHGIQRGYSSDYVPFNWTETIEWSLFSQLFSPNTETVARYQPTSSLMNTVFYAMPLISMDHLNQSFTIPKYWVSSIVNGLEPLHHSKIIRIFNWMKDVPQSTLIQLFRSVPAPAFDFLRERVFTEAVHEGERDVVQAILSLGVDPSEKIAMREGSCLVCANTSQDLVLPLQGALEHNNFDVAKTIVSHLARGLTEGNPDSLLNAILAYYEKSTHRETAYCLKQWKELLAIPLSHGAVVTVDCFKKTESSGYLTLTLLEASSGNAIRWIQAGLLGKCIINSTSWQEDHIKHILSYFVKEGLEHIPTSEAHLTTALVTAFHASLDLLSLPTYWWVVESILKACSTLNIALTYPKCGEVQGNMIIKACQERNWILVHNLLRKTPKNTCSYEWRAFFHSPGAPPIGGDKFDRSSQVIDLEMAITMNDLRRVSELLPAPMEFEYGWTITAEVWHEMLIFACDLNHTDIAAAILKRLLNPEGRLFYSHFHVYLALLKEFQTAAISVIINLDQRWNDALSIARAENNFIELENLLFRIQGSNKKGGLFGWSIACSTSSQQIVLRLLAYHAIHTNNPGLMTWLCKNGLEINSLNYSARFAEYVVWRSSLPHQPDRRNMSRRAVGRDLASNVWIPSLLAVAAYRNNPLMLRCILSEGPQTEDSYALLVAVKCGAGTSVINLLLDASENNTATKKGQYGSDALREAIRGRDNAMICLLIERVNIHSLNSVLADPDFAKSLEGFDYRSAGLCEVGVNDMGHLSPLGEAIISSNYDAARLLLSKGVSPNGLVSYNGIRYKTSNGAFLHRLSPLLSAIDMGDLSMVQILVENGADVEHPPRLGLLRTPLQRAAESGNFDIVKYLLEKKAIVDSPPFYSGGTPLQLAALSGYVGVAALLLENGADPNFLPAEGDGRTAFEAAAEWSRVDMMCLLFQSGIDFNLVVSNNNTTQYDRAIRFAEKRGQMAAKRFVQKLKEDSWTDLVDFSSFLELPEVIT